MPVSLCEWRVRIGTFVHWIRDYEIRERKERWLKERTRILKVLCERLKAKKSDSELEKEEDDENTAENRQEGSSRQCPHRTNINSSGSFDIKDLLTSCDQCIHDLLTSSHCCSKDLLTPADGCIKELLQPPDSTVKDLITPNNCIVKDLITQKDCSVKDLTTPDDCRVKDLVTPDYCSVKDLITPDHCSVKDLITPDHCSVKDLITPDDCSFKALLTAEECSVKDLIAPPDRSVKNFNTSSDFSVKDLITPDDCNINVKDLISPDDCSIKVLLIAEGYSVKDLITPHDCSVKTLITPDNCRVKDLTTPQNCSVEDLNTSNDCSVRDPITTLDDCSVKDLITPHDCSVKDLITPQNCSVKDLITPDDCSVKDRTTTPDDCSVKDLITPDDFNASTPVGGKISVIVEDISRPFCNDERRGKTKEHGRSTSLCHGPSLASQSALIPEQTPPISKLLLLKSGDVELNPGPRAWPNLELERELMSLVAEISPQYYTILCNSLGVGQAGSEAILTKNLLNVPKSLFEIICSWGERQRDCTDHKKVLADKLKSVHLDALGTKLLEGGYLPQENPIPATDGGQHLDQLTPEQVTQCGKDFKTFYRTWMCKIKTDPLDFEALREFETIYTNLELLRNEMGTMKKKKSLKYDDLLTTKVNDELPKRLMIQGEGGSGKTTFCSKIAWDWSNGHKAYKQFDWVIVIPMREIQGGQSVGDIAKTYLSDSNMVQPGQINDYILSQPSKVFLIFDGLDEYGRNILEDESDFGKIIRSEKYKECTMLVTSRPWKANQIKSHQGLCKTYMFIGVEGFSPQNVSSYITEYFVDDKLSGADLIQFIEDNEVVQMDMAPFPIYVAMLCILWQESTNERREIIRKLKTFSQLFRHMITFLADHFLSKANDVSDCPSIDPFLLQVGKIAFSGLLEKQLMFNEDVFDSCKEAMDMCTKIGVLSREKRFVPRVERRRNMTQPATLSVSFPHKLFQEYLASLYLASLYDSNFEEYRTSTDKILEDVYEFEYLIYFTSSQGKSIGLDIINRLINADFEDDFLVDVAFEAGDPDTGNVVEERVFAEGKSLRIDGRLPAHTFSGYLFILEKHAMGEKCINSLQELHINPRFINALQKFDISIDILFPRLKQLRLDTVQPVSPDIIKRLAHSSLSVFKIALPDSDDEYDNFDDLEEDACYPVPLIGEPDSLKQLFSISFPHLTNLIFENVVIGNIRCEAILRSLRDHTHIKVIRVIKCYTDDELDSLASEISKEKSIEITLQHDPEQNQLDLTKETDHSGELSPELMDAFCHRTCVRELYVDRIIDRTSSEEVILDMNGTKEVESKIHKFRVESLQLQYDQSVSYLFGRFISLLPCLTDLEISSCSFHNEFYTEMNDRASFSKIQTMNMNCKFSGTRWVAEAESKQLAKLLCSLPCLKDLTIEGYHLRDYFFTELTSSPASSQIKRVIMWSYILKSLQVSALASKQLAKFLCSLPCLSDLRIRGYHLHDDFFTELNSSPASSQIQTMEIISHDESRQVSPTASKQLAKLLCSLPYLESLAIGGYHLHDDFYIELSSSPASSQKSCLREMLKEWSARRRRRQVQLPPTHEHRPLSTERVGSNLPSPRQPVQPSVTYQNDPQRDSQAESDQVHYVTTSAYQQQLVSFQQHLTWTFQQQEQHTLQLQQPAQPSIEQQSNRTDIQSVPHRVYPFVSPTQQQSRRPFDQGPSLLQLRPAQPSIGQQNNYRTDIQSEPQQVCLFMNPTQQHSHWSYEQQGPNILQPGSAQSSVQYHHGHQTRIQSEHEQVEHPLNDIKESAQTPFHIPGLDELTKTHLQEFDQYIQSYLSLQIQNARIDQALQCTANSSCQGLRSLHTGLGEATQDTSVGQEQRDAIQIQDDILMVSSSKYINSCTSIYRGGHSIGMKPMYEFDDDPDRPSTSGFSSAYSRAGATPAYDESTPVGRKRMYSNIDSDDDDVEYEDDDDHAATGGRPTSAGAAAAGTVSIAESREHRPRKRLAKTDRNPPSP